MPVHSKHSNTLRAAGALLSMSLLAACSSSGGLFGGSSSPSAGTGPLIRMQDDVLAAVCEGHAEDAVAIMSSEPLMSPTDRFFVALATEVAGHPARARQLYARVMQSGATERVNVECGRQILADGPVSDEAAKRLAAVARDLAVLDANLRPTPPLHTGLPAAAPTKASATSTYTGPALPVTTPGSVSPFGQWFVHLASYRSMDNATKNRTTIEQKFPALSGILDQWEVNVNGTAIRLGVRLNDRSEATGLCNAVKSQGAYCAVLDTSQ